MNFIEDYLIKNIRPAEYNPRFLDDDKFEKLQESIKKFGMCKPIIINKDGTIVAGHQRTKTLEKLGIVTTPCLILNKNMQIDEEIRFNLMHNSIENETSSIKINLENTNTGYQKINPNNIEILNKGEGNRIYETCNLINKYGDYGCVICDIDGNILHNADYGFCSKLLNRETLIYVLDNNVEEFKEYIREEYGEYSYQNLGIKSYVQTHCQIARNGESLHSRLYEKYILPNINKEQRLCDFGAGQCFYINRLKNEGYKALCYEPFFNGNNSKTINIKKVKEMIKDLEQDISKNGLYDVVILDSVINSVINDDFEKKVLITCNSLLNKNGIFYCATRNIEGINRSSSQVAKYRRQIQFLDKNNYTGTFRKGVWTMQHFHTFESFKELLERYFKEVHIEKTTDKTQLFGICKKPKRIDFEDMQEALNVEFNMEYPNGLFLNVHSELVKCILNENYENYEP